MTEFIPVSWTEQPVSLELLSQMVQNDQALYEMKPTLALDHQGVTKDRGMKILAGSTLFQPTSTWSTTKSVYFGNFFSAGCSPVIIPTLYSYPQTGLNLTPTGLGGVRVPDHRGFNVYVWCDDRSGLKSRISHPFSVVYMAAGF